MPHGAVSVEAKSLSVGALLEGRYPFVVPLYQPALAWEVEAVAHSVIDVPALLEDHDQFRRTGTLPRGRPSSTRPAAFPMIRALMSEVQWTDAEIAKRKAQLVAAALRVFVV